MPFTPEEIHSLPAVLSAPRFATYLAEKASDKEAALELYRWNMELSAAFFCSAPDMRSERPQFNSCGDREHVRSKLAMGKRL